MAKGEHWEGRVGATPELDADSGQQGEDESNHGSTLVTHRNTSVSGDRRQVQAVEFTSGPVLATHHATTSSAKN